MSSLSSLRGKQSNPEMIYAQSSKSSTASTKRRRPMLGGGSNMAATGCGGEVRQRVLSAQVLKVKQLQNKLGDAQVIINELTNENRILKQVQKKQDSALNRYEHSKTELPNLLRSHDEELRSWQTKARTFKEQCREVSAKLKEKDNEINALTDQYRHLQGLCNDRNLGDREQLTYQVNDLQDRLAKQDTSVALLQRRLALETKNLKSQYQNEVCRHKETRAKVDFLNLEVARLGSLLEAREKCIIESRAKMGMRAERHPVQKQKPSSEAVPPAPDSLASTDLSSKMAPNSASSSEVDSTDTTGGFSLTKSESISQNSGGRGHISPVTSTSHKRPSRTDMGAKFKSTPPSMHAAMVGPPIDHSDPRDKSVKSSSVTRQTVTRSTNSRSKSKATDIVNPLHDQQERKEKEPDVLKGKVKQDLVNTIKQGMSHLSIDHELLEASAHKNMGVFNIVSDQSSPADFDALLKVDDDLDVDKTIEQMKRQMMEKIAQDYSENQVLSSRIKSPPPLLHSSQAKGIRFDSDNESLISDKSGDNEHLTGDEFDIMKIANPKERLQYLAESWKDVEQNMKFDPEKAEAIFNAAAGDSSSAGEDSGRAGSASSLAKLDNNKKKDLLAALKRIDDDKKDFQLGRM